MDSAAMNAGVLELNEIHQSAFPNSKPIPYMGWFWRTVDFNDKAYSFGVCESGDGDGRFVAFMENNKWDYDYVEADTEQFGRIKRLLETAINTKALDDTHAVWDAIQKLGLPAQRDSKS